MASQVNGSSNEVLMSNLPLLFSKGHPTSIDRMSLVELQNFIPFLLQCVVGKEIDDWSSIPRPFWWPENLPFKRAILNSFTAPQEHWRENLRSLVYNCYIYHASEYLLHFCEQLVAQCTTSNYSYIDNNDGSTSMMDSSSGKLYVTFRNENRTYDHHLYHRTIPSPRRTLLPRSPSSSFTSQLPTVLSNLKMAIYLCDSCDEEFASLEEIQQHEPMCAPCPPSPMESEPSVENEGDLQMVFCAYFTLKPTNQSEKPSKTTFSPRNVKHHLGTNYNRYCSIAVSSPLGQNILTRSKLGIVANPVASISRYERCCVTNTSPRPRVVPHALKCFVQKYPVTYRKSKDVWTHKYCFNRRDRQEKVRLFNTGLNFSSRQLLKKCRRVTVPISRLKVCEIRKWTDRPRIVIQLHRMDDIPKPKTVNTWHPCNGKSPAVKPQQKAPVAFINLCSSDEESETESQTMMTNGHSKNVMGHWPHGVPPRHSEGRDVGLKAVNGQPPSPSKLNLITGWLSKLVKLTWKSEGSIPSPVPPTPLQPYNNKTIPKDVALLLKDECKELRVNGLQTLLSQGHTVLRSRNCR